ncbi:MAG: hypothetical protein AAFU85_23750, partial [Planctomycetota bacterium]
GVGIAVTFVGEILSGESGLFPYGSVWVGILYGALNVFKVLVARQLLRPHGNRRIRSLRSLSEQFGFLAICYPFVAAVVIGLTLCFLQLINPDQVWATMQSWFCGDVFGLLIWFPAIACWLRRRPLLDRDTEGDIRDAAQTTLMNAHGIRSDRAEELVDKAIVKVAKLPVLPSTRNATVYLVVEVALRKHRLNRFLKFIRRSSCCFLG